MIDLDRALAAMARPDVRPAAAERIRRRAQAELARERAVRDSGPLRRAWERALEPALATAAVAVYLGWAVRAVLALR